MKESLIEAEGVKYAEKRGWLVFKWSSPGKTGIHDRLHLKNGMAFTIEYKSTGKKASAKQMIVAQQLQTSGTPARCIDNVTEARQFIDIMTGVADLDNSTMVCMKLAAINAINFDG